MKKMIGASACGTDAAMRLRTKGTGAADGTRDAVGRDLLRQREDGNRRNLSCRRGLRGSTGNLRPMARCVQRGMESPGPDGF